MCCLGRRHVADTATAGLHGCVVWQQADLLFADMVIQCDLPLRLSENLSVRRFANFLRPGYVPRKRTTVTKHTDALCKASKQRISVLTADAICVALTTDAWTSGSREGHVRSRHGALALLVRT